MKKIVKVLGTLVILLIISFSKDNVQASLATNELIAIKDSNNQNYIVVTKETTINDIMAKYGSAKVITDSAFGGKAYTFYTDNNYSSFLYVETTKAGKIISYGSVGTKFETQHHVGGTKRTYNGTFNLSGYVHEEEDLVYGVVQYNKDAIAGKTASAICTDYVNTYKTNPTKYLKGISEQGVTFYNALSHFLGNDANLIFDERMFYINEQLKEFGSSIRLYMQTMDKSSEVMKGLIAKNGISMVSSNNKYVLNPLQFGALASANLYTKFEDKNIAVFDYCEEQNNLFSAVTVSPDCFERVNEVSLTAGEIKKLNDGRKEYESAIKNLYAESEIYEINPVETPASLSELVAGKLKASKKQGITDYVNAIRVAAGLPKLNLNEDCFNTAQHISTLMSYRWQVLKQDISHRPDKSTLPGITDEYYNTAIGGGKVYYENLGRSSTKTTIKNMMNYIGMFLDDTSEKGLFFSHRQKIMHADYTEFGYGVSAQTFSNEFTGYNKNDIYLEAWPANGITFLESVINPSKIYWTAQFTDKYKFLDTTDAKITCLNTGDTWNFTDEMITDSKRYSIQINNISSLNNRVVMYDSGIRPHEGYVYEVEFTGIQEVATGKIVNYSYRTVFEYADLNNSPSQSNEIKIDKDKIDLTKVDGTDTYYLPVNEDVKLSAIIDDSAKDKKVTWTSSDPTVTVTQNGIVHAYDANINHPVTISVIYDATSITSSVTLLPYKKTSQVNLELGKTTLTKGQSTDLVIKDLPDDIIAKANFYWYIESDSEDKRYAYTDFKQYVEIKPYENNKLKAQIIAHDAEINNNKYTIGVEVEDVNGNIYTGECKIEVLVPLESFRISIKTVGIEMLQSSKTVIVDLSKNNIDFLELKTKPTPTNITVVEHAKWTVSNTKVLNFTNEYLDGKESIGKFKVVGDGETNVTAEIAGKTYTVKVVILGPLKENGVIIQGSNKILINQSQEYTFTTNPNPTSDTVKIIRWENKSPDLISIKEADDPKVDFYGNTVISKKAIVTAKGKAGKTATIRAVYTINGGKTEYTVDFNIQLSGYLKGDMNTDGFINSTDAALVLDKFKNGNATTQDYELGDMNNDSLLNSTDASMILDIFKTTK